MSILISTSILMTSAIMFPVIGQTSDSQDIGGYQDSVIISDQAATSDFTSNPQNFAGFYYDLDNDVGTEELTTTLTDGQLSGSEPFGLSYQTTAQETLFDSKAGGHTQI